MDLGGLSVIKVIQADLGGLGVESCYEEVDGNGIAIRAKLEVYKAFDI